MSDYNFLKAPPGFHQKVKHKTHTHTHLTTEISLISQTRPHCPPALVYMTSKDHRFSPSQPKQIQAVLLTVHRSRAVSSAPNVSFFKTICSLLTSVFCQFDQVYQSIFKALLGTKLWNEFYNQEFLH